MSSVSEQDIIFLKISKDFLKSLLKILDAKKSPEQDSQRCFIRFGEDDFLIGGWFFKAVAHAVFGKQINGILWVFFQFLPQPPDVGVDIF